ncbi:putative metal-binding protein [Roseibium album]|nr:putative metal-binding protein [Roseibium album]
MSEVQLFLCKTCNSKDTHGTIHSEHRSAIEDALGQAGLAAQISVASVDCLGACERSQTLAIRGKESAALLFGSLELPNDIPDIISTCRVYLDAKGGWIEDARGCGRLRLCLIGRIPG